MDQSALPDVLDTTQRAHKIRNLPQAMLRDQLFTALAPRQWRSGVWVQGNLMLKAKLDLQAIASNQTVGNSLIFKFSFPRMGLKMRNG